MSNTADNCRQALVVTIGFLHVAVYLLLFFTFIGGVATHTHHAPNYGVMTKLMTVLCVPVVVSSVFLIKAAIRKRASLFIPWFIATSAMVITIMCGVLRVLEFEQLVWVGSVLIFSFFSIIVVNVVFRKYRLSSSSTLAHCGFETYRLNNLDNRRAPSNEPQCAVVNRSTNTNSSDEPPPYEEAMTKTPPYNPYAVSSPTVVRNPPYPVANPTVIRNPPYPVADRNVNRNPPYPVTDPIVIPNVNPNPPYPVGDPVGVPMPPYPVAGSTGAPFVGWRPDLVNDNRKM